MLVELTSHAVSAASDECHVSVGLKARATSKILAMADGESGGGGKEDDEEIDAAFERFDMDGSGEIDAKELTSVAAELGVPMSDKDLEDAMRIMDADGSGEVDKAEFKQWYKSLSEPSDGADGMSQMERLKLSAALSSTSVAGLSRRQGAKASPLDALIGSTVLGSCLEAFGCGALPCQDSEASDFRAGMAQKYRGNQSCCAYTVTAHGSADGVSNCDGFSLSLPESYWQLTPADPPPQADFEGDTDAPPLPAMDVWALRLADALCSAASASCGPMGGAGSGVKRAPPPPSKDSEGEAEKREAQQARRGSVNPLGMGLAVGSPN